MPRKPNRQRELAAAFNGPMTKAALQCKADAGTTVVHNFLAALLAATPRKAHISGWERAFGTYGPWRAIYSPGDGVDAPFVPSAKTATERVRDCRERKRKGRPVKEKYIAPAREPFRIPERDLLTAALFGPGAFGLGA